jgi:hypothetical protein
MRGEKTMSADFASTADLTEKPITFDAIGPDLYGRR